MSSASGVVEAEGGDQTSSWDKAAFQRVAMGIVKEALERYRVRRSRSPAGSQTAPGRLSRDLKDRYGIISPRGQLYSDSALEAWADGESEPPTHVLLAIARLTNQSLDGPLGMADEMTEQINLVSRQVEAIRARMGMAVRERSRGKRGTSPSGTSS